MPSVMQACTTWCVRASCAPVVEAELLEVAVGCQPESAKSSRVLLGNASLDVFPDSLGSLQ